ncbi:MAG TPA: hypothetical protein VIM31_01960 [Candidatus Microsaccharimonas sp.]|jgi:hypothetical protein
MDESGQATAEGETCMKDLHFDALIVAARPKDYRTNTIFTEKVMTAVRSSEILSSQIRKTSVNKKETLFMKLRHLPKFAIVAIAIGALLVISGSAYAAYQLLWPKPHIEVSQPTTSTSGRQEVAISLAQCGSDALASHYELKSNATITIDEVPMVLKAHCELGAIGNWANTTFPNDGPGMGSGSSTTEHNSTNITTSMATHIKAKDVQSITFEGLTKYNQTDATLTVTPTTRYIADGHDVPADQLRQGDAVVYISSNVVHFTPKGNCTQTSCSMSGGTTSTALVAIVKLDLPFQYYDQFAWQSLSEVAVCNGNPADVCTAGYGGAIDLYNGNAVFTDKSDQMKEIQGVVTQLNGTSTVIRSSSGTLFTIVTASDVVTTYNTQKAAQYYNNQLVKVGSTLFARYVESSDQHSHTIYADHLISFQLSLELVGKSDPIKAY